jgi:hypothetical protein
MKQEKNGECDICKTKYQIIDYCKCPEPCSCGPIYQDCPACGFNPKYEKEIFQIIDSNIRAKITSFGIRFNDKEIISKVNEKVLLIWPKKEKKVIEIKERDRYKEGECDSCHVIYAKEVEDLGGSNPNDWGYFYKKCPNCFYSPQIKEDISELIRIGISADINDNGKVRFNVQELSDLVINELVKFWSKPEGGKQ